MASCSAQQQEPVSSPATSASVADSSTASQRDARGPDDPESCLTQDARDRMTWEEATRRKLEERLAIVDRCAPGGAWTAKEHFSQAFKFAPNGTVVETYGVQTSMKNCSAATCIAKELADVRADAPPPGFDPVIGFSVIVEPKGSARSAIMKDFRVFAKPPTECSKEADSAKKFGRLPPEEIQRIFRSKYGEFRSCYEEGLARTHTLTGRVDVRFVIERDGSVGTVMASKNTLSDCKVVECVLGVVPKLKFPPPAGDGVVTVVYPVMLEPG
jgi:hypothetical protein